MDANDFDGKLSVLAAASEAGCHLSTIERAIAAEALPVTWVYGRRLIDREALTRWNAERLTRRPKRRRYAPAVAA